MPSSKERPLLSLQPVNKESRVAPCLKVLTVSGWNPPPGTRKMHGELSVAHFIDYGSVCSHISGSQSPDSPYGSYSLLIWILYLLILLALWIREIQDGGNENNKMKTNYRIPKINMKNLKSFFKLFIWRLKQMIIAIEWYLKQLSLQKSKFSRWILPRARFSHSLVLSRIQRALSSGMSLRHGFDPFPFVFALRNISPCWSAILSESETLRLKSRQVFASWSSWWSPVRYSVVYNLRTLHFYIEHNQSKKSMAITVVKSYSQFWSKHFL